jgi:YVTN family beta-propeller protein
MERTRREFITGVSAAALATALPLARVLAQPGSGAQTRDRVILCNEDSNTLSVIDPNTNTVATTINLTWSIFSAP